ncbi:MAG: autotransporter outer membrane beta-barrel domain-containing protein, partial [Gammaproteobacteria bacterium]
DGNEIAPTWTWVPAPVFIVERTIELANFPSAAGAVGHGLAGDGTSVANGSATARAWGIRLGDGDNLVENQGSIFVTADANAHLRSSASGGTTGDASVSTSATANAFAWGVQLGGGDNLFTNGGTLDVEAIASATAEVVADAGDGVCISFIFWTWCIAPGSVTRNPVASRTAAAVGVVTGGGDDTIVNAAGGQIIVRAGAAGSANLAAAGIVTGAGNDVVVNEGLVSATTVANGVPTAGIGIDTGAGNDQLTLGDGSEVVGSVTLGDGDDTLTLAGTPSVRDVAFNALDVPGGAHIDTLVLQGAGGFANQTPGFERAIKNLAGTYSLPSLAPLDYLEIDGGVLALGDDYAFPATGLFDTYIHSDGDRGQLLVTGGAVAAGAIDVERRGDDYIADGSRYSVVVASGGVGGGFTDVTLPAPLPLLAFSLEQTATTVDVMVDAPSFSTVATNLLHEQVGDNLYGIAPDATGDFARRLGTLQRMPSGFDRALASLAPDAFESLTTNTIVMGQQATELLRTHLANARGVHRGRRLTAAAYEPVMLAEVAGDLRVIGAGMQAMLGQAGAGARGGAAAGNRMLSQTWTTAYHSTGDIDFQDGFTEYDFDASGFMLGADRRLGERTIAGIMLSYADTSLNLLEAVADADVEGWSGGLYATHWWDRAWIEGGASYANQSFDVMRELEIAPDQLTAFSSHDGETMQLWIAAGREFDFGGWQLEPYASLQWFDIDEDAFEEEGAESLNLLFGDKSTDALLGEAGARFTRLQRLANGMLEWHGSLAYHHDFDSSGGTLDYAYAGDPGTVLVVDDRNVSSGSSVLGAGLSYLRGRSTLALDYRGQFNGGYRNHVVGLRLSLAF